MLSITAVQTAIKNAPTALVRRQDGRQFYLHSRVDPREEARFLIADLPAQERTLYVVIGFGLGYHVEALLERVPSSSHVVVLESAAERLSTQPSSSGRSLEWRRDPRLHVLAHDDATLAATHLADRLTALHLLSIKMLPHLPSMQTAPVYYNALAQRLPALLPLAIERQLSLLDKTLESDLRNFWANLSSSWNAAPATRLRGRWAGRPLVIVSSGPSLTAQLPALAELRDRVLLLATGSTARTLVSHGIAPDLVVSVDPYDLNLAHFDGWDSSGIPLAYYHRIHHDIPRVYAGPMFAFTMRDEPALPLLEGEGPSPFTRGGTVAFSALQLAHLLGASPIVFVGQDFAFAGGRTHADGALYNAPFDPANPAPDIVQVEGVSGQPVATSHLLQAYLLHMQDYLRQVAQQRPDIVHINASSTGARIQGADHQNLGEALRPFAAADPPARERLQPVDALRPAPPLAAQAALLDRWIAELDALMPHLDSADSIDLLDRCTRTLLFAVPGRSYQDIRYLYETKYQRGAHAASGLFASRLRHHIVQLLDDLRRERAGL